MPGERLTAADLQDRFALGLTPIREALMRLSAEGLVDTEVHRGARVADVSMEALSDLMSARRGIERLRLTAAIEHGSWRGRPRSWQPCTCCPERPCLNPTATATRPLRWEVQHRRFHGALVAACNSDWLLRFWNTLADHSERFRKIRRLRHREAEAEVRDVNAEHRAIMAAVLDRDVVRANDLMDEHLRATEKSGAVRPLEPDLAKSQKEFS